MNNISISNVYATVPATKADAGYSYEGPVEDLATEYISCLHCWMPKMLKLPTSRLKNIEIHYPGGGDPNYAKVGLDELDKVPEIPAKYPEFSMFKELPAWGFYIRHAEEISFRKCYT